MSEAVGKLQSWKEMLHVPVCSRAFGAAPPALTYALPQRLSHRYPCDITLPAPGIRAVPRSGRRPYRSL